MSSREPLYDGCPTAHALDLIGNRWALLVVRELLIGPKRFTDLCRGLPRISRNVLSQRLDDLAAADLLTKRTLPPPASSTVYELTTRGLELETVMQALGRWGAASPLMPEGTSVSADTFVLGLRARFQSSFAQGHDATYDMRVGDDYYVFEIDQGRLTVSRGSSASPAMILEADLGALAAVARGSSPLASALTSVGAQPGNPDDLESFAKLFAPGAPDG